MTASIPGSQNPFPSVRMIEAADPTDYPADATGEQRLVVGPDHLLYLVDDTATATLVGGAVADIVDIPTAETDDTLVLAPDGAGGVEFRAEAGGVAPTGCIAQRTTNVTITSTSYAVPLNAADIYDPDGWHDPASNNTKLTCPTGKGGRPFTVGATIETGSGTAYAAQIRRNGSTIVAFARVAALGYLTAFAAVAYLADGDYIELVVNDNGNDVVQSDIATTLSVMS